MALPLNDVVNPMTLSTILYTYLFPLLVNWLILFVACYIVVEYAQNYFYDESTPYVAAKVAGGTFLFAVLQLWTRTSFDTMFTSDISKTVIQGVVWFAVFTLIFRFHPWHALAIGVASMLLLPGLASLGRDSLIRGPQRGIPPVTPPSVPVRQPSGPPRPIAPTKAG